MSVYTYPDLKPHSTKRVIIAGSRDYSGGIDGVAAAVKASGFDIEVVLSGCARGVDRCGEQWAARHGIAIETYPAKWEKYGRGAGPKRNAQMSEKADALIALWDGESPGTRDVIERMADKPTLVYWDVKWE